MRDWTIEERAAQITKQVYLQLPVSVGNDLTRAIIAFAHEVAEEAARICDEQGKDLWETYKRPSELKTAGSDAVLKQGSASAFGCGWAIRRRFGLEQKTMTMTREAQAACIEHRAGSDTVHLAATLDEVDALLLPFAALWHELWQNWPDDRVLWSYNEHPITVGDVREARAYLARREGEK